MQCRNVSSDAMQFSTNCRIINRSRTCKFQCIVKLNSLPNSLRVLCVLLTQKAYEE